MSKEGLSNHSRTSSGVISPEFCKVREVLQANLPPFSGALHRTSKLEKVLAVSGISFGGSVGNQNLPNRAMLAIARSPHRAPEPRNPKVHFLKPEECLLETRKKNRKSQLKCPTSSFSLNVQKRAFWTF